jgi:hypothetical protein
MIEKIAHGLRSGRNGNQIIKQGCISARQGGTDSWMPGKQPAGCAPNPGERPFSRSLLAVAPRPRFHALLVLRRLHLRNCFRRLFRPSLPPAPESKYKDSAANKVVSGVFRGAPPSSFFVAYFISGCGQELSVIGRKNIVAIAANVPSECPGTACWPRANLGPN